VPTSRLWQYCHSVWYGYWLAQMLQASVLAVCVHVRSEDRGSTPGADRLDTTRATILLRSVK